MEETYKFEFTASELSDLVMGVITAKCDEKHFIEMFPEDPEAVHKAQVSILRYAALLDKLRRDYK